MKEIYSFGYNCQIKVKTENDCFIIEDRIRELQKADNWMLRNISAFHIDTNYTSGCWTVYILSRSGWWNFDAGNDIGIATVSWRSARKSIKEVIDHLTYGIEVLPD